jgi:hypothetical protein
MIVSAADYGDGRKRIIESIILNYHVGNPATFALWL